MPEMENLFRLHLAGADRALLEKTSGRCKIQNISRFENESHWVVDRWWTRKEKITVGAEDIVVMASKADIDNSVTALSHALSDYQKFLATNTLAKVQMKTVAIGDLSLFSIFIGKRVLKKDVSTDQAGVPVFSANVDVPMGYLEKGNLADFTHPAILWGIDGTFNFRIVPAGFVFATTDHCGTIKILDESIDPEYVLHALHVRRVEEDFDRSFRASLTNMRKFGIKIPIDKKGKFDLAAQKLAATRFLDGTAKKAKAVEAKKIFDDVFARYIG
ncbi:MAG: restriction endonuclease subunit S [Calditrichaeota bacterium]|nr:restriction endonuclease subunit S [Calditrichota bacterium]